MVKAGKKTNGVVVQYRTEKFSVHPFKACGKFDMQAEGMLVPFYFVQSTDEEQEVNMEIKLVNYQGLQIPALSNPAAMEQHTLLVRATDDDGSKSIQGPPAKKQKKGK